MIGYTAGYGHSTGSENVFLGYNAGTSGSTGAGNTLIGSSTAYSTGINNATAVGKGASVNCSDCLVLGNSGTPTQVGIGYNNPTTVTISGTAHPFLLFVNAVSDPNPFNGNANSAFFNGNVYSTGAYLPSDSALKNNIVPLENNLSVLSRLSPHSYTYDRQNHPGLNLPGGTQNGLIAEELEQVAPQLVSTFSNPSTQDSAGNTVTPSYTFKAVNYTGLIPLLLGGIKEQQHLIDSLSTRDSVLESRLNNLESLVNNCCGTGRRSSHERNTVDVELSAANSIILNQNDPNPFSEQTTIRYSIPENVSKAEIIFFDNNGKVLKSVMINERGEGQLIVYASNLSNGIYSYSLLADGKMVDTKKMVKQD